MYSMKLPRSNCAYRGWNLLAAHVRSNHVHIVVEAEAQPERNMNEFKSYASRELNQFDKRETRSEAPVGYGRMRLSGRCFDT